MSLQIRWTTAPSGYHARDDLRGPVVHGPGLLDSSVLGPCAPGDALHHLFHSKEALGMNASLAPREAAMDFHFRTGGCIVPSSST